MAKWGGNKVNPEQINNGNEYTTNDNLSVEAVNGIVNNSINAQTNAERALELAESAHEANGTLVKINGENQATWDATAVSKITNQQVDFVKSEYEKSLNLYNKNNAWISGANNQNVFCNVYGLDVGTYTFNVSNYTWAEVVSYNSSNNIITRFGGQESSKIITFTTTSDTNYVQTTFHGNGTNLSLSSIDFTQITLNKGRSALPYQDWKGKSIWTEDIKPVELFSGATENSLTMADVVENYDYVQIFYDTGNNNSQNSITVRADKLSLGDILIFATEMDTNISDDYGFVHHYKRLTIRGNTLTILATGRWYRYQDGGEFTDQNNRICIHKILGYKEVE